MLNTNHWWIYKPFFIRLPFRIGANLFIIAHEPFNRWYTKQVKSNRFYIPLFPSLYESFRYSTLFLCSWNSRKQSWIFLRAAYTWRFQHSNALVKFHFSIFASIVWTCAKSIEWTQKFHMNRDADTMFGMHTMALLRVILEAVLGFGFCGWERFVCFNTVFRKFVINVQHVTTLRPMNFQCTLNLQPEQGLRNNTITRHLYGLYELFK